MRKQYTLSEEDYKFLLNACKPVPYMVIGGVLPRSPQENANDAWEALGNKLGFDYMTVKPYGSNPKEFTAEERVVDNA